MIAANYAALGLILSMGALDRYRGDNTDLVSRTFEKLLYGFAVAALVGHVFDPFTVPIIAAMALGMSPGWGEPLGALLERRPMVQGKLEWWQRNVLQDNAIAALCFRGLMWGAPLIPVLWYDPSLLRVIVAFAVAVPVAPYLFRDWEIQEFARGLIAGSLILCLS